MRRKITVTRTLKTLIEAKERMDENDFNSYSFRIEYPEWGAFCSILKKNGVIEKSRMKHTWISIEPNLHMAEKVLSVYHQKVIIARNNYISKKAEKTDEIINKSNESVFTLEDYFDSEKKVNFPSFEPIVDENDSLHKFIEEKDKIIDNQKETIKKQDEKLVNQFSYISDLEEIMENYKKDIDTIEKEFVELKKSISHQNNLFIKPNSKKIKFLGIPIYSVEY